ncbi:transposase [Francisella philomiragia]|uniref:Transposase IS200 like family protein n=1 Tax=Francisella philomiragia TaxID=28110 RepID=A0AAW3D967_9GAMM|nr:transposase [Francisella philomiragia]KFJ42053.1 transposase IS200 like family protein [Francisella philomiragia]MBK2254211.1 transposase [Francisella philomiragia]MBK2272523.1 transposase [Francisella philomiragia]MBK2276365.1 transposase [Francisella philomiragia]MBK2280312.1 transposase [Francisella philomiragia]
MLKRANHRLENFDYSQNGYYYVTICTKDRISYFGEITSDGEMILNNCGSLVFKALKNVPQFYNDVFLDEFIVMPNHIHAIVIIQNKINVGTEQCSVQSNNLAKETMTAQCAVTTKKSNLSQIIKSYKNVCTKQIRNNLGLSNFQWQRSFYDHIVRDEQSLLKIREYVQNNPVKWHLDKYNCENQNEY